MVQMDWTLVVLVRRRVAWELKIELGWQCCGPKSRRQGWALAGGGHHRVRARSGAGESPFMSTALSLPSIRTLISVSSTLHEPWM